MIFLGPSAMKGGGYIPLEAGSAHALRRCGPICYEGGWIYPTGGRLSPCTQKVRDIPRPIRYEGGWIYALTARLGPCAQKAHDIPWPMHYEGGWIYPLAGRLGPCAQKAHDIPRLIHYEGGWILLEAQLAHICGHHVIQKSHDVRT